MNMLAEAASGFDAMVNNLFWTIGVFVIGAVVGFGIRHFFAKKAEKLVGADIDGDGKVG